MPKTQPPKPDSKPSPETSPPSRPDVQEAAAYMVRPANVEVVVEGWLDGDIRWYIVLSGTPARQFVRSLLEVQ